MSREGRETKAESTASRARESVGDDLYPSFVLFSRAVFAVIAVQVPTHLWGAQPTAERGDRFAGAEVMRLVTGGASEESARRSLCKRAPPTNDAMGSSSTDAG